MANYKRRSRRRDKRTMLPCGCCEDIRGGSKLPVEDGSCMGKKRAAKPRKPKEKCPVNGTHEWYTESETHHGYTDYGKPGYWRCDDCHWEERGFYTSKFIYCPAHLIRRPYTEVTKIKTCIHCWTEKKKYPVRTYDDGKRRYLKNLVLKKRPLKF